MQNKAWIRAAAAVCVGVLFGLYVHHDYSRWSALGLDSFLNHESLRFNRYMATPQPMIHTLILFSIAALLGAGLYESIVKVLSKLVSPRQ